MTLLLRSFVCDYCDGTIDMVAPFRAFVVWPRGRTSLSNAYVFPDRQQAADWVRSVSRKNVEIREVRISEEPTWTESTGTSKGIRLADSLYEIFPDHRFRPGARRAFLA